MHVSQIELFSAIGEFLESKGVELNARQMNAVIAACNDILDELNSPHRPAVGGSGLNAWLASDDTGMSSMFMARVLSEAAGCPGARAAKSAHPHDPSDFGRCVRMLQSCQELRPFIAETMPKHGPEWAAIAKNWDSLETLYHEEYPTGEAPRLYSRMRELIDAASAKSSP